MADADVHGVDAAAGDGKAAAAVFVHAAGFEVVVGEDGFRLPGEVVVQAQGVFAFGVGAGDAGLVARGMALRVVAVVDVARAFEARLAVGEAAGEAEVAQGFDGVCANVVAVAFEAAVVAAVGFFAADAGGDAEGEVAGDAVADADAELVVVCFAVAGFQGVVVGEAAADGGVGFALAQGARVVVKQFAAGVLVRGEGRCRDGAVGVVRYGVGKVLVDGFFGLCVFRQVGAVFQRVVAGVAPGRGVAVVGVGVGGAKVALAASWSRFRRARLPTVLVAVFAVVPGAAVLLVTLLSAPLAGFAVALFGVAFTLWPGWRVRRC